MCVIFCSFISWTGRLTEKESERNRGRERCVPFAGFILECSHPVGLPCSSKKTQVLQPSSAIPRNVRTNLMGTGDNSIPGIDMGCGIPKWGMSCWISKPIPIQFILMMACILLLEFQFHYFKIKMNVLAQFPCPLLTWLSFHFIVAHLRILLIVLSVWLRGDNTLGFHAV